MNNAKTTTKGNFTRSFSAMLIKVVNNAYKKNKTINVNV